MSNSVVIISLIAIFGGVIVFVILAEEGVLKALVNKLKNPRPRVSEYKPPLLKDYSSDELLNELSNRDLENER